MLLTLQGQKGTVVHRQRKVTDDITQCCFSHTFSPLLVCSEGVAGIKPKLFTKSSSKTTAQYGSPRSLSCNLEHAQTRTLPFLC